MPQVKLRQDTVRSLPYVGRGGKHQCIYWDETFECRIGRHRHYFRREELYNLVWTAPVSEIALRLGVSDVGLAKLCRRASVPLPARGYWARVESGQSLDRPPLPPAPAGLPELLRIRGRNSPAVAMAAAA